MSLGVRFILVKSQFFTNIELTQFTADHPELIDASSRTGLYKRAAAILVRPGNPKNIRNVKDLTKPGIKLLDVNGAGQFGMWEGIAGKQNLIAEI